jgi:hypothetical protein
MRSWLYDLPLSLGVGIGVVIGLIFGSLLLSIALGFAVGNLVTYGLRVGAGFPDPSLVDRMRRYFRGRS